MLRILLITLALSVLTQQEQQGYFLSPPLPPLAFAGEFYTTRFRVVGPNSPPITYLGLPLFLQQQPDGSIAGTPTVIGSFAFSITFQTSRDSTTRNMVLRVVEPSAPASQEDSSLHGPQFLVKQPQVALTYLTGNRFSIHFEAVNGK